MEKVKLLHPQGKQLPNIDKGKYDLIKKQIVGILSKSELTHDELFAQLNKELEGKFEGNISWYAEGVKLDLEARKIVERTNSKPQKYRLIRRLKN